MHALTRRRCIEQNINATLYHTWNLLSFNAFPFSYRFLFYFVANRFQLLKVTDRAEN